MADKKITELPAASAPDTNDLVPIVEDGTTSKATIAQLLALASTPALVALDEEVLSGAAASIVFSSIPGTYRHLQIDFAGATSDTNAGVVLRMRFNADTGNNYDSQMHEAAGAGLNRDAETNTSSMRVGKVSKNGDTNHQSSSRITIPNYASSSFYQTFHSEYNFCDSTPSVWAGVHSGMWHNAAVITEVTLYATAGNLKTGTVATLYGLTGV